MQTPEQRLSPPGNRPRLFVALPVAETVKEECSRLQDRLKPAVLRARIRWANAGEMHLTLKFLGDVEDFKVAALSDALRHHCAGIDPPQLEAKGVGFFPSVRSPRVVWVGAGDSSLVGLRQSVEAACAGFTDQLPEPDFKGHLTLGRIKSICRQEVETLTRMASAVGDKSFGNWIAKEVVLFRSELSAEGPQHTALARIGLGIRAET